MGRRVILLLSKLYPWPLCLVLLFRIIVFPISTGPGGTIFHPPFPSARITAVEGVLASDPGPSRGRGAIISLEDVFCRTRDRGKGSSKGRLTCLLSEPLPEALKGEFLSLRGRLISFKGGWLFRGTVESRLPGPSRPSPVILRSRILRAFLAPLRELGSETAGLVKALLFGLREDLAIPLYEGFRRGGILHILALSGMHLGLLTGVFAFLLYPVLGRRRGFPLLVLLTGGYLYLTGLKVSLLRAAVMFFLLGTARWIGRERDALRSLGGAFLFAILISPGSVSGPGFQLSFAALGGILIVGRPLAVLLGSRIPSLPGRWFGQALGISLGAQCATAPILLHHFGELVPLGVIAGIVVTPAVTLFLLGGLLFLVVAPWAGTGIVIPLASVLEANYRLIEALVGIFSRRPPWSPQGKMVEYLFAGAVLAAVLLIRWRNIRGFIQLRFP